MNKLKMCKKCFSYTLRETCAKCGSSTYSPHPPRYSKEDKHAAYRRKERFFPVSA